MLREITMKNKDELRIAIGNAIRSLYQMIMAVNDETLECHVIDFNAEIRNISDDITSFDTFCEDLYENIHPEDRDSFKEFTNPEYFPNELSNKVYTSFECRIKQTNGNYYWSKIIFCNATKEDSYEGHDYLFLIQDIHELKTAELREEAEERAILKKLQDKYDALFEENMTDQQTGCYNRKGMKYYTDIVIDEAKKSGRSIFVCVADLNGLKHLNDVYGHLAGDEGISVVSGALRSSAPKGSRIVRTGGDEFLIFAALDKDSSEPIEMDAKIEGCLKEYNASHSNPYEFGVSYGWGVFELEDGMTDIDQFVAIADSKMYEMKKSCDKYRRS
jgi:diguanylate cyclase (GGDEF)-like protein